MAKQEDVSFTIPSSPSDLKKIKSMMQQAVDAETRIAAERDAKKEICAEIHTQFEIPKKIVNRMVKTMYKHNFSEQQAEMDDFQVAYEKITQA